MTRISRTATGVTLAVTVILLLLIYIGSRQFRDFDSALIGYMVGSVFAIAAMTYRYTLWISRPPTWRYFRAGWTEFLSWKNFRRYTFLIPKAWWTDIFGQTFIRKRGMTRWVMHMSIFWGVVLSCLITFPLTFGWIHFTLVPPYRYKIWFFGVPMTTFPISAGSGFAIFHALDFTAALLIIGLGIAFWRRLRDAGQVTMQRFGFDLLPLVLLFAIAVTGLALSASYSWWSGRYYAFITLTHEVVVVLWLLSMPFGKFFHIVQRPASIGVTLYQTAGQEMPRHDPESHEQPATCRRCGQPFPSGQFIQDLEAVLNDLGQNYDLGDERGHLQDYCPTCKRVLRGEAYYALMGKHFL